MPHFAAEYPDQAATNATSDSITASPIDTHRSRLACSPAADSCSGCSVCSRCSAISFPTSLADRPSATPADDRCSRAGSHHPNRVMPVASRPQSIRSADLRRRGTADDHNSPATAARRESQRGVAAGGRRVRDLRDYRRPGKGDDLPLAVPSGGARAVDCPIIGVAVSDWSADDLRSHAREAIVNCGTNDRRGGVRSAGRPDVLRQRRLRRPGDLSASGTRDRRGRVPRVLPGDPAVSVRTSDQGIDRGGSDQDRAGRGREAVRPRPRVRQGTGGRDPPVHPRGPAVPDRPLPGEDGHRARSSTCGSPTRCSSRSGTATTSRACRSRWPRASASRTAGTSTTPSARCATSSSTT